MYRISCVKYTNSIPFIYGLEKGGISRDNELSLDTPADCYSKLESNKADIGLVPVVALKSLSEANIISPYCIGTQSKVKSVILVTNDELKNIKRIYLDYQSRTSVQLVKILARELWNINPEYSPTRPGFIENDIEEESAFVVIGDRAFSFYNKNLNIIDLGEQWFKLTGKPFVFACWIANKTINPEFIDRFNASLRLGLESIDEIIKDLNPEFELKGIDLKDYFFNNIEYNLDIEAQKGMELFLNLLQ